MPRRPRESTPLAEPDELDRLVEVEQRLEKKLAAAREEGRRRVAAAEEASRAADQALERDLAPVLAACRERAARRLAGEHERLRGSATERVTRLEALSGDRFEALVAQALESLGSLVP